MCQLALVNLNDELLNRLYLQIALFLDSLEKHQDGVGFFCPTMESPFKTKIPGVNLLNLSHFIKRIGSEPTIGHVRMATTIFGAKKIEDKHAHPFETENLILAHNGTLNPQDEDRFKEEMKELTDTEIFLNELEKVYSAKPTKSRRNFTDSLKKTMEDFYGKFAFLIFDKNTKDYYVVRGKYAPLHQFEVKTVEGTVGLVVNTDEDSLKLILKLFTNICNVLNLTPEMLYDAKNIKCLEAESIYRLEGKNKLKKVTNIKENYKKYNAVDKTDNKDHYYPVRGVNRTATGDNGSSDWAATFGGNNDEFWANKRKKEKLAEQYAQELINFREFYGIDIQYLDELMYITLGRGLLGCTLKDFELFLGVFVGDLATRVGHKNIIKEWKKLEGVRKGGASQIDFSNEYGLIFPYWLEKDITILRNIRQELERKYENPNG